MVKDVALDSVFCQGKNTPKIIIYTNSEMKCRVYYLRAWQLNSNMQDLPCEQYVLQAELLE